MAAPTVNAVNHAFAGTATDLTLSVPTHSTGDLLVWITISGNTSDRLWTFPSGWTVIGSTYSETISGNVRNFQAYYRIATGSEPGTYAATRTSETMGGGGVMYSISGADDPATTAIVRSDSADGSGGTASTPSITPTDADSLVIRFAGVGRNNAGAITPPTGYTEQIDQRGSSAVEGALWAGDDVKAASATGTESFSYTPTWWSSPAWGHTALAIAPTSGGATGSPWYYYAQL